MTHFDPLSLFIVKISNFGISKMADGRLFEKKPLNRHNSAVVRRIAMKFGVKRHKTLLNLATDKI